MPVSFMPKRAIFRHYMTIPTLLATVAVSAQDDRTVTISTYTHDPCEVVDEAGYRQLVYPRFAQHGGATRISLSGDGYWNCNTRLNAGVQACEEATSAPRPTWGIGGEVLNACDAMFESMVGECVAHYERQRHKCSADGDAAGHADASPYDSEYTAALENALAGNDYRAALDEAERKAAERLRWQEEERKRKAAQSRNESAAADSRTNDRQAVCLQIIEEWSGSMQAVNEDDACNMANSMVRISSRVLDNLAANSCPAEHREKLNEQIDYWRSLAGSLCF